MLQGSVNCNSELGSAIDDFRPSRNSSPSSAIGKSLQSFIVFIAVISLGLNILESASRILQPYPKNPWEASVTTDSFRRSKGIRIYQNPDIGPSTAMYGFLSVEVLGFLFRVIPPNNYACRLMSSVASILVLSILVLVLRRRRPLWMAFVSFAMLASLNTRSNFYFVEGRPDMVAILFGVISIVLMHNGLHENRCYSYVTGIIVLLIGFSFKQTCAVFAIVPIIDFLTNSAKLTALRFVISILPIVAVLVTVLLTHLFFRDAYYYLFTVPSGYEINLKVFVTRMFSICVDIPLFVYAITLWFCHRTNAKSEPLARWLILVCAVAASSSCLAASKAGGTLNSYLPAWLAMMVFCLASLEIIIETPNGSNSDSFKRISNRLFVASLFVSCMFPAIPRIKGLLSFLNDNNDPYYAVISSVRDLSGTVVSPEDPTIAMFGKGYVGRNVYLELDSRPIRGQWQTIIPAVVLQEMAVADFVVNVGPGRLNSIWDVIDPNVLSDNGFKLVKQFVNGEHEVCYELWKNELGAKGGNERSTN